MPEQHKVREMNNTEKRLIYEVQHDEENWHNSDGESERCIDAVSIKAFSFKA